MPPPLSRWMKNGVKVSAIVLLILPIMIVTYFGYEYHHETWPTWVDILCFLGNIGLIVAASFLNAAIHIDQSAVSEASKQCLRGTIVYFFTFVTVEAILLVAFAADDLNYMSKKRHKDDKSHTNLVDNVFKITIPIILYAIQMSLLYIIYRYYKYVRGQDSSYDL